jgi:hypothetical protein
MPNRGIIFSERTKFYKRYSSRVIDTYHFILEVTEVSTGVVKWSEVHFGEV